MLLFLDQEVDVHADWIEAECKRRNIPYFRFCTEQYPIDVELSVGLKEDVVVGVIQGDGVEVPLSEVQGVWLRRPGAITLDPSLDPTFRQFALWESRQSLAELYYVLNHCRWVNPPGAMHHANHRLLQQRVAASVGLQTSEILITNNPDKAVDFFYNTCRQKMVYKPLYLGLLENSEEKVEVIYTTLIDKHNLDEHLSSIRLVPCQFQRYIPKKYELRINVIGDYVWAAAIYSQDEEHTQLDYRQYTESCRHGVVVLPAEIERKCLAVARRLGLRMGNIDMIVTPDDEYIFLEINVNGQWAWIEDQVGFPLATALVDELMGVDTLYNHPYRKHGALRFEPNTAIKNLSAFTVPELA